MLVVGGGVAGLASAIELTSLDLEVVVAEAQSAATERFGETLAPGVLARLDRLGLAGDFVSAEHLTGPGTVVSWGSHRVGHNDFVLDPRGPAWHIDRVAFEDMLRQRAIDVGATVLTSTRAVAAETSDQRPVLLLRGLSGSKFVHAEWVVDASGPTAWFARRQGARREVSDRLVALVRTASLRTGRLSAQTVVEASAHGWWYLAPLPHERSATVFVTDPAAVSGLVAGGWGGWRRALAATRLLAGRLEGCELGEERFRVRSIPVSRLDRPSGERWLAVGDAAAELDPITGRGIHDALSAAADAARWIGAALDVSDQLGWSYPDRAGERFDSHLAERIGWYARERRWPDEPFWSARTAGARTS